MHELSPESQSRQRLAQHNFRLRQQRPSVPGIIKTSFFVSVPFIFVGLLWQFDAVGTQTSSSSFSPEVQDKLRKIARIDGSSNASTETLVPFQNYNVKKYMENLWNKHKKQIEVLYCSPGSFEPTVECPTPRVWLFVSGHYRSYHYTRVNHRKMLTESDPIGNCFFVVMVIPWVLTAGSGGNPEHFMSDWRRREALLPHLRDDSSFWDHRFAYMVLDRFGIVDTYGPGLCLHWYALWVLARWAAAINSFEIDPRSLVIRSRPDMAFENAFDFRKLLQVIKDEPIVGLHLQTGQMFDADLNMFASFSAYETDIALPQDQSMRTNNSLWGAYISRHGWGRGRVVPEVPACGRGPGCDTNRTQTMPYCRQLHWANDITPGVTVTSCAPYVVTQWENHCICRLVPKNVSCWIDARVRCMVKGLTEFARPKQDLGFGKCVFPVPELVGKLPKHMRPSNLVELRTYRDQYIQNGGFAECLKAMPLQQVIARYPFQ